MHSWTQKCKKVRDSTETPPSMCKTLLNHHICPTSHLIIITINTEGQIVVLVRVLTRKKLIFHFEIKSPTLQNYKICASLGIEMVSSRILRFLLAKRSCLTFMQPINIRAANAFAALASLVWRARSCFFQRAICHLAARHVLIIIGINQVDRSHVSIVKRSRS